MNNARLNRVDSLTLLFAVGYSVVAGWLFFTPAGGRLFAGHVAFNLNYYHDFAVAAANGLLPYRDIAVEYPPLGAAWLWALAPFAESRDSYYAAFAVGMFALSIAGLFATFRLGDMLFAGAPTAGRRGAVACMYTGAILAAGPVVVVSLDYMAMALTAWAIVELGRGRSALALGLLAAGAAAKGYPLALFPLFMIECARRSGRRGALEGAAAFIVVSALLFGIPALLSPDGLTGSFAFHAGRGIEKHSTYGAALMLLGLAGAEIPTAAGNLAWPPGAGAATDLALKLSSVILLLLLARAYGAYARALQRRPSQPEGAKEPENEGFRRLLVCATLILAAALVGFKVSSPQFLSWLVPGLAALALERRGLPRLALFAVAGFAAQWLFPWNFDALTHAIRPSVTAINALKAAALIGIFIDLTADAASRRKGGGA